MLFSVYPFYFFSLKIIPNKYVYFSFLKCYKQNISIFFRYKFMYLSLCNQLPFFKSLTFFLYSLFKGYCFSLSLEGKRFKFLINNFFLFFKMDTSHFKYLKFTDMFFLKKFKKNKRLIFYSFDLSSIKYNLLKIQKFKKPTKYKKKGLFLKNLY